MDVKLILYLGLTLSVTGLDQAVIQSPRTSALEQESSSLKKTASAVKSTHLNASRRHLTEISSRVLSNVSQPMFLDLSFNYITNVDSDSFDNAEIQEVNLQGNEITQLSADVFSKTPLLSRLDLSHNKIRTLKTDVFVNSKKLRFLSVSHNKLAFIYTKTFESSINLEELYLDSNDLRFLNVGTFASCTKLRILNLSNNSLRQLPGGLFQNLGKLETLLLGKNSLKFIPREVFASNPKLRVVDLSENRLARLESSIFEGNRLLESLRLQNNSWVCDSSFRKVIYTVQRRMRLSQVLFGSAPYKGKVISMENLCPRVLENRLIQALQTWKRNNNGLQFSLSQLTERESVKPNTTTEIPKGEDFLDSEEAERDLALIFILSGVAAMTVMLYISLSCYRRRRISKSDQIAEEENTKQETTLA